MQIFFSDNSPYARIVRIAARAVGLTDRIEWTRVRNRAPDSPLLAHSPVCRVPTLVDGGLVLGEARNICGYLDSQAGTDRLLPAASDWPARSLESMAIGFLDGIAVWVRELRRKRPNRSAFLLDVEARRAERCLDYFEAVWAATHQPPPWDFGRMALACALDIVDLNHLVPNWPDSRPALAAWIDERRTLDAMHATKPLMDAAHQTPLG